MVMAFEPGRSVHFPKAACAACPLRVRCTTSSTGRSVAVHPDEALLVELRQRQQTPQGRARLRERTKVEHSLAHIGSGAAARAPIALGDLPSAGQVPKGPTDRLVQCRPPLALG